MIQDTKKPSVVILGAIHGDERIGAEILQKLEERFSAEELHGKLELVLGNPKAYEKNTRFVDSDLNRMFGEDPVKITSPNYEQKRALELTQILEHADFLLDIHATIKPSVPFVYTENTPAHLKLAHLFGTKYIVSADASSRPKDLVSSADNFVDRHSGIALTYETGWHENPDSVDHVLRNVINYLSAVRLVDEAILVPKSTPKPLHLVIFGSVIPRTDNFKFSTDYSNFDHVKAGTPIANDSGKEIIIPRDCYIVFPKKDIGPGKVACYIASN